MSYTEQQLNLNEFISFIFENEPLPENSVPASFYNSANPNLSLKELFSVLNIILVTGMKIRYGTNINLDLFDNDQFNKIIKYFKSFGITFIPIKIKLNNDKNTIDTKHITHFNEQDFKRVFPRKYNTTSELTEFLKELIVLSNQLEQTERLTDYFLHIKTDNYLYRFLFHVENLN